VGGQVGVEVGGEVSAIAEQSILKRECKGQVGGQVGGEVSAIAEQSRAEYSTTFQNTPEHSRTFPASSNNYNFR